MARLAYLEMCFPCTIYSTEFPIVARRSFGTSALLFETLLSLTVYKKQAKRFPQMFTFDSRVKKVSCACRPEFSTTSLIVELVEDPLYFGIARLSRSARQAGSGYFACFCPLSRIFMNEIRLMRISFSCTLFTGRVTKTTKEGT